jgi:hypothetical protein
MQTNAKVFLILFVSVAFRRVLCEGIACEALIFTPGEVRI